VGFLDWLGLGTRTFRQILRLENEQKVCKVQTVKGVGATGKEFPLTNGYALLTIKTMNKATISERTIIQNLLMAYMCSKAASEAMQTVWSCRDAIDNKHIIGVIKEAKPKINYFIKQIDETLLSDSRFKSKDWEQLQDSMYKVLEGLDEELKKL